MLALIKLGVLWAWSFVSPWLGPLLTKVAPFLAAWFPGVSPRKILRGIAFVCVAGLIAWLAWRWTRPDPDAVAMVAVPVVEAQRFRAENEKLKAAIAKSEETIRLRAREAELADQYIEALKAEKEALRAQSSDPDAPVFAADDPWLRGRR